MNLALVGYGRMGKAIEKMAPSRGHAIVAVFDENAPIGPHSHLAGAEVLVDFSTASAVPDVLRTAASLEIPVVEGTTGWYGLLEEVSRIPGLAMVYSPNFSVGVFQFARLVQMAGSLLGAVGGYDAYVHEWHHAGKADSPSGTARRLAALLVESLPGKTSVLETSSQGVIPRETLHVTSTRVGRIPGIHEVGFDSEADRIVLRHEAHGRESFAWGALLAAEWIRSRQGIYSMDDFMASIAAGRS